MKKVLYAFSLNIAGKNFTGIWERAALWDNIIPPDGGMEVRIAEMLSIDRCPFAKKFLKRTPFFESLLKKGVASSSPPNAPTYLLDQLSMMKITTFKGLNSVLL